jgi:hypothetical protein
MLTRRGSRTTKERSYDRNGSSSNSGNNNEDGRTTNGTMLLLIDQRGMDKKFNQFFFRARNTAIITFFMSISNCERSVCATFACKHCGFIPTQTIGAALVAGATTLTDLSNFSC